MSRKLLQEAAKAAGITEEQADKFVRTIMHNPTSAMAECGRDHRFMDVYATTEDPQLTGLTSGEWDQAVVCYTWRAMCSGLLACGENTYDWLHKPVLPRPSHDTPEYWLNLENGMNKTYAHKDD